MMHNYYGQYSTSFGGGPLDFFLTIIFWVLIIYLVVNIVRWLKSTSVNGYHGHEWRDKYKRELRDYKDHVNNWDRRGDRDYERTGNYMRDNTALDILKERYAKGEISKTQYEDMRRDLM